MLRVRWTENRYGISMRPHRRDTQWYLCVYKYFELTVEYESRAYSSALTKSQLIPDLSLASIRHETLTIHGSANRLHIWMLFPLAHVSLISLCICQQHVHRISETSPYFPHQKCASFSHRTELKLSPTATVACGADANEMAFCAAEKLHILHSLRLKIEMERGRKATTWSTQLSCRLNDPPSLRIKLFVRFIMNFNQLKLLSSAARQLRRFEI